MAVQSKAQVCSFYIAWVAGSNSTEGMDIRYLCLLFT
jgi:hypothetical protein